MKVVPEYQGQIVIKVGCCSLLLFTIQLSSCPLRIPAQSTFCSGGEEERRREKERARETKGKGNKGQGKERARKRKGRE